MSALSLGLSAAGEMQIAAGQGYPPKQQYGVGGSIDLAVPLDAWLELAPSFQLFNIFPSDAQGGFTYRGFVGSALSLMVNAYATIAESPRLGKLEAGGGAGGAAALTGYQYTTLYFFYVEAQLQALLRLQPAALPRWSFLLAVPVKAQFRRDMDYSVSAGVSLGAAYKLGPK